MIIINQGCKIEASLFFYDVLLDFENLFLFFMQIIRSWIVYLKERVQEKSYRKKYNSLFLFRFNSSYIVSNPCVSRLPRCYEKGKAL